MGALAEKLRRARESEVPAGDLIFTIRRPTDLEMAAIRKEGSAAALLPFVIGWKTKDGKLPTEVDLGLPNGDPHPLPFDAADCAELLADRSDLFAPIVDRLLELEIEHAKERGEAKKA